MFFDFIARFLFEKSLRVSVQEPLTSYCRRPHKDAAVGEANAGFYGLFITDARFSNDTL